MKGDVKSAIVEHLMEIYKETSNELGGELKRFFENLLKEDEGIVRSRIKQLLLRATYMEKVRVWNDGKWEVATIRVYIPFEFGHIVMSTNGALILLTPMVLKGLSAIPQRIRKILEEEICAFLLQSPNLPPISESLNKTLLEFDSLIREIEEIILAIPAKTHN